MNIKSLIIKNKEMLLIFALIIFVFYFSLPMSLTTQTLTDNNICHDVMYFDGVDDRVTGSIAMSSATDFYVELEFVYQPQSATTRLFSQGSGGTGNNIVLEITSSNTLSFYLGADGSGLESLSKTDAFNVGQKHKVKVEFSGGTHMQIFIDDVSVASKTISPATISTSNFAFSIGARTGGITPYQNGTIYNVDINNQSSYQGYGNTNADWEDQIGSNDGTVSGSPTLIEHNSTFCNPPTTESSTDSFNAGTSQTTIDQPSTVGEFPTDLTIKDKLCLYLLVNFPDLEIVQSFCLP